MGKPCGCNERNKEFIANSSNEANLNSLLHILKGEGGEPAAPASILPRKCGIGKRCIGGFARRVAIAFNLNQVFVNSGCIVAPDVDINLAIVFNNDFQRIIDTYIIPDCSDACTGSFNSSLLSAIGSPYGVQPLNGEISIDPPTNCCRIDRTNWETLTAHVLLGAENDMVAWSRMCFFEGDTFPTFTNVTPLGVYTISATSSQANITQEFYNAAIAPLTNSSCFVYAEVYRYLVDLGKNVILCRENPINQFPLSLAYFLCICIIKREEQPPPTTDIFNTKEDFEVMKGLWIGNYAHEEFHDSHIVKRAKVIDTI